MTKWRVVKFELNKHKWRNTRCMLYNRSGVHLLIAVIWFESVCGIDLLLYLVYPSWCDALQFDYAGWEKDKACQYNELDRAIYRMPAKSIVIVKTTFWTLFWTTIEIMTMQNQCACFHVNSIGFRQRIWTIVLHRSLLFPTRFKPFFCGNRPNEVWVWKRSMR